MSLTRREVVTKLAEDPALTRRYCTLREVTLGTLTDVICDLMAGFPANELTGFNLSYQLSEACDRIEDSVDEVNGGLVVAEGLIGQLVRYGEDDWWLEGAAPGFTVSYGIGRQDMLTIGPTGKVPMSGEVAALLFVFQGMNKVEKR
jgi:hypothetical protein